MTKTISLPATAKQSPRWRSSPPLWRAVALALASISTPSLAQSSDDLAQLRRQLDELKSDQRAIAAKIEAAEAVLAKFPEATPAVASAVAPPAAPVTPASAGPGPASIIDPSKLQVSGDLRLRHEMNFGDREALNRDREVVRARLRANYSFNSWLTIGAQVATGDPDDPNTTDITLSNWDDKLDISLDQIYARARLGPVELVGGRFQLPFAYTETVWDNDVNLQGAAASLSHSLGAIGTGKLTGAFFAIDEAANGPNSRMLGAQAGISGGKAVQYEIALAYYAYSLRSLAGADAGDFRGNLRRPDGGYLSDFDLFDVYVSLGFEPVGDRWPVKLVGNYVKNSGASTAADSGYEFDVFAGRNTDPGDWRFGYGWAAVETDAVLAAFSHDNIGLATNYLQHMFLIDYVITPHVLLNATLYRYRPWHAVDAGPNDPRVWLNRLRVNAMLSF